MSTSNKTGLTPQEAPRKQCKQILSKDAVVTACSVSAAYIAVSLDNTTIHVFSAEGQPLRILNGHSRPCRSQALQGNKLLAGDTSGEIRVWDLSTGEIRHVLGGHDDSVHCLAFVDSKTAISASKDSTLKIWNLESGACKGTLIGHSKTIAQLAIEDDVVVSGSYDCTGRTWSLSEARCLTSLVGHTKPIHAVAFDGARAFTGGQDRDVRVWNARSGECIAALHGHTALVTHLQISGNVVVSAGGDGQISVWAIDHLQLQYALTAAHKYAVTSLDIHGDHMISGGTDGLTRFWDKGSGAKIAELGNEGDAVWNVKFGDGEGRMLITTSWHDAAILEVKKCVLE